MAMLPDTLCDTPTVYVPEPPVVPVSCAVTMVLAVTPEPLMRENKAMAAVPVIPDTVSVVPEMDPVNCADPVAAGQ